MMLVSGFESEFIFRTARRLRRRLRSSTYDLDDISQHLSIELWQQQDRFNPERGTWEAFVTQIVRTAACKLLRHVRAVKRDDRLNVSLVAQAIVSAAESNSDLRMDLATAIKRLSPNQKRFLAAISTGPRDEVRATLGISRRKFDSRKQSLKRAFCSLDLHEYCC